VNIIEALDDQKLLGAAVKDPATFFAWRALLKGLFGLPMSDTTRRNSFEPVRAAQTLLRRLSPFAGWCAVGVVARASSWLSWLCSSPSSRIGGLSSRRASAPSFFW
jgi:hypothetical protein